MVFYVLLAFAVVVGYSIPVLVSLFLSMAMGRFLPRLVRRGAHVRPSYLVLESLVWGLSAIAAGYTVARIAPGLVWIACAGAALLLVTVLWSNSDQRSGRTGFLQLCGMTAATLAGTAAGCTFFVVHR